MENLGLILRLSTTNFKDIHNAISSVNLNYVLIGIIVIFSLAVIVTSGASLGLCKMLPLGRLCHMESRYRTIITVSSILALVFWIGYYLNMTKQTNYLASAQVKQFFPSQVQLELASLQNNSKWLLILANVFSLPIYFLFLSILVDLLLKK